MTKIIKIKTLKLILAVKRYLKGQTLLEVVIAVGVGSIFVVGTVYALSVLLLSNNTNRKLQTASDLAGSLMDNVKAVTNADWNNIYSLNHASSTHYYISTTSSPFSVSVGVPMASDEVLTVGGVNYTRYFYVDNVSRDACGTGSATTTATTTCASGPGSAGVADDPSTQKITVTVTWPGASPGLTVASYLTRSVNKVFTQTDWSGGAGQETFTATSDGTVVNNKFASSTSLLFNTSGAFTLDPVNASGTLYSSVYDTLRTGGAGLNSIMWEGTQPAGASVKFQIAASNDLGGAWSKQTQAGGYSGNFNAVAFGGGPGAGFWVAVGDNGEIQTSTNGTTWTHQTPALIMGQNYSGNFYGVVNNGLASPNNLWVAVGSPTQGGSVAEIETSPDGINWTHQTPAGVPPFTGTFYGITYAGSGWTWIAVGSSGEIETSQNGTTWIRQSSAGGYAGTFYGIANNGNNFWTAVGSSGEIQTSPDGTTWTHRTQAGGYSGIFHGVVYNSLNLWVAVGDSGEIETSPDGTTAWTKQTQAGGYSGIFHGAAFGKSGAGVLVAVGSSGEIQTSGNGTTWTHRTQAGGYSGIFHGAAYNGSSLWMAVGSGGEIETSPDGGLSGATWSYQGSDGTSGTWYTTTGPDSAVGIRKDQNNKRYVRYVVRLDGTATKPTVNSVILNWSP